MIGALIAAPLGILTGLYLTEFAGSARAPDARWRVALDVLQGVPTIVTGLFIYGLIVIPAHQESGIAGAIALAIVMLPLMARASQEVLLLVPGSLREAADSLGVARWRAVLTVIVPAAAGGIVTGADPRHRPSGRRDRAAADLRLGLQPERHPAKPVPRGSQRLDADLPVLRSRRT